ncbi:MAG: mechanosensitive ion channel family protein [Bacillota bacterium]|nr:mechanosensitive ion channel family protein [Bacillota bacterium]
MDSGTISAWGAKLIDLCSSVGTKIILALLIFIIGRIVIKKILTLLEGRKFMDKIDPAVRSFLMNFIKIALYVVLVISIISVLGVPMASIITVLATCGLAVGMALQGALANLAGGIMLLVFRPFNIGDLIVSADTEGVVKEMNLFYTVVNTLDNKVITIPNGTLMAGNITNVTKEDIRRVDLTFNVSGADLAGARKVMLEQMNAHEKVLDAPEPPVAEPLEGVPGGMSFTARAWTKTEDYWDVYFGLMESIPTALGEAGVGGPLPAYHIVND